MKTITNFKELGVSDAIIKGLTELNITEPTEIQVRAIPYLLDKGSDFIGQAQTGTGKTAAFGIPILQKINANKNEVQALILAPTRELVQQIAKQLFRFTKYTDKIFVEAVYGGEKIEAQIAALQRPTHVVVATPGRLIDLLVQRNVNISKIKTLVLDEADEMLSMGFADQMKKILEHTEGHRNTWLFSATMPKGIKDIISKYMSHNAQKVHIDAKNQVNKNISHSYTICTAQEKNDRIIEFLDEHEGERGVIFCRTKAGAITLTSELAKSEYQVDVLHGDMNQTERDKVMRAFKKQRLQLLVATDVAARGIDIAELAFVLHQQLPDQIEYYTHRSGRTARAGKRGISHALIHPRDVKRIQEIEEQLNIRFTKVSGKKASPWGKFLGSRDSYS